MHTPIPMNKTQSLYMGMHMFKFAVLNHVHVSLQLSVYGTIRILGLGLSLFYFAALQNLNVNINFVYVSVGVTRNLMLHATSGVRKRRKHTRAYFEFFSVTFLLYIHDQVLGGVQSLIYVQCALQHNY